MQLCGWTHGYIWKSVEHYFGIRNRLNHLSGTGCQLHIEVTSTNVYHSKGNSIPRSPYSNCWLC
jgi:hypothetical protein